MTDLVKRARRLDTCIFPTERSKCLCGELADHIQKLEEQAHYANGVADLAMKHRNYAEQRVEKLEAALREIAQTFTIVDENWRPSYHDFSFTQKQAEGAYEELGRRIQIARKALEGKDD